MLRHSPAQNYFGLEVRLEYAAERNARLIVMLRRTAKALHLAARHNSSTPWHTCPHHDCHRVIELIEEQTGLKLVP